MIKKFLLGLLLIIGLSFHTINKETSININS